MVLLRCRSPSERQTWLLSVVLMLSLLICPISSQQHRAPKDKETAPPTGREGQAHNHRPTVERQSGHLGSEYNLEQTNQKKLPVEQQETNWPLLVEQDLLRFTDW